jgi:hypothetical protein
VPYGPHRASFAPPLPLVAARADNLTEREADAVSSLVGATVEVRVMKGQWWRFGRNRASGNPPVVVDVADTPQPDLEPQADAESVDALAAPLLEPSTVVATSLPDQPVLLNTTSRQPARIGELLPARHGRSLLPYVRLPAVPKRVILAAGVCAGLAGPAVARHVVTRLLVGRPAAVATGAIEITRIIYSGPLTPQAAAAIGKALTAARR